MGEKQQKPNPIRHSDCDTKSTSGFLVVKTSLNCFLSGSFHGVFRTILITQFQCPNKYQIERTVLQCISVSNPAY